MTIQDLLKDPMLDPKTRKLLLQPVTYEKPKATFSIDYLIAAKRRKTKEREEGK